MGSKDTILMLVDRLERKAVDFDHGQAEIAGLQAETVRLRLAFGAMEKNRDADAAKAADLTRAKDAAIAERDVAARRLKEVFPFLLDSKRQVYVAFENETYNVGGVKDDAGDYQGAGDQPDYASLISAPLNPRCFLTCNRLRLVRLPCAPTGKLRVDDDIPF